MDTMQQEQQLIPPNDVHLDVKRERFSSSRLIRALLIGVAIMLMLTVFELCVLLLFNPFHILGSSANRFAALGTLPVHAPLSLILPLVEVVVATAAVLVTEQPLALVYYLREARSAQEDYHTLYTPLTALTNIRRTPDAGEEGSTVPIQEERIAILDLVQQQDTDQLILGVPGAGKTTALRVYQYIASEHPLKLILHRGRVPIYVPMKNYSLFLKTHSQPVPAPGDPAIEAEPQVNLLDFLYESDLPGMLHLRPYLGQLARQGRLLLLCDGLNEVDNNYLFRVSEELVDLMRNTQNRLVMTCREVDYREQPDLVQLVDDGRVARATIYPLQTDQIYEFVERYVERQDKYWRHTAGQIIQVIDRSRLRYHCTNPMMLFLLMGIIDKIGVERGKQIDTRGRLLREFVKQLLEYERQQPKWSTGVPVEREVVRFLGEVACAARWANDRNAIQLRVTTSGERVPGVDEVADELRFWLDEHPAQGPLDVDIDAELLYESYDDVPRLLQFALSAALIEVSPGGVLSFRHELIAEYFVAEYFYAVDTRSGSAALPLRGDLLENVGRWSESVALWAGLLDNPLSLAERFGELGRSNPGYVLQALALGLVCVGVLWTPTQAEVQRSVTLPQRLAELLAVAVRNRAAREELAHIFTRCAEEGGQEVYRSLLPLITVEGVDELLILLDQSIVPELLFTQLVDTVDNAVYDAQAKRLTSVLGRFGTISVAPAAELSQPLPERSTRLRAAAINILGGTGDIRAVEPLVVRLSDTEPFIVNRAANALVRLGPELTMTRLIQELEDRQLGSFNGRVHQAVLAILTRFMDERDPRRQVTSTQYQRMIENILPVLTSNYQAEPEVQELVRATLVQQAQLPPLTTQEGVAENRSERVIEALIRYLPSQNEVAVHNVILTLQEIGNVATPYLLEQLQTSVPDAVRVRVLEILKALRDPYALPHLLQLLEDASPHIQQQGATVLVAYAPQSIPGLLDIVLHHPEELVAERATRILIAIGPQAVEPITAILLNIVPERTRLLVQVLEQLHEPRSLPALLALLQTPEIEPLLAISIIRALSQFDDPQVVPPLLVVLSDSRPQVYEEAINALSQLGEVALNELVAALDTPENTVVTQRIQRAILGMTPFPGTSLITILPLCTNEQALHIMDIFKMQGADAAHALVQHLLHKDERVRRYIQQTLNDMPGAIVVPALLEVLNQPALFRVVRTLLLNYPEAIIPLVNLLGDPEQGEAAATILPLYGPRILRPLVSGLEDQRNLAREYAQSIMVALVRQAQGTAQEETVVREIIHLFSPPLPPRAHEFLLEVLTDELAEVSTPILLEGLEDAHLVNDMAEAFVRLIRRGSQRAVVLESLRQALYMEERRRGAEDALIKAGSLAIPVVGELITDSNQPVAHSARNILAKVGVPALAFIWNAYSDKNNKTRREAAQEVFRSIPTNVIKDELVNLLGSSKPDDIAMAVSLLLERIHDEAKQHYAEREMIPELLSYVLKHHTGDTNLRIISLLLILGQNAILDHLLQALDDEPQHQKQLAYILLLLGQETQETLLETFNDPDTSIELRADLAAVLGMLSAPDVVTEYAQNLSTYGVSPTRTSALFPNQLVLAQRALGGLLAGGQWNDRKLKELRDASPEGSASRELFNVLLGWRYEPMLAQAQNELQNERDAHKKEILTMSARIMADQNRISALEDELEQVRREHGIRGDELHQTTREKETLRANLEKMTDDKNSLADRLERAVQENQALRTQNEALSRQDNQVNRP